MVGTFVGFDDNRSLGHGETGAVAAVPIFIEFMQEALKGTPMLRLHGRRPDAKFARSDRNREAFRPGTEPSRRAAAAGAAAAGRRRAGHAVNAGRRPAAAVARSRRRAAAAPKPAKPPATLNGLF